MTSPDSSPTHAGGIVIRDGPDEPLILLVRARTDPTLWIFPKGHIEAGETAACAALREVREEAGVAATVVRHVGDMPITTGRAAIFLMRYIADVPASEQRESTWCSPHDACRLLTYSESRALLARALGRNAE